eukprot:scaffold11480_cov117-Cylindrotheca_fusiformis.AAC.1
MRSIPCEKESCLWKLQRTRILEKDICSACKELNRCGFAYLTSKNKTTKGVCYLLYPEKEPEEEKRRRRAAAAYENKENQQGEAGVVLACRSRRKRSAPTEFEACPSGGPHQVRACRKKAKVPKFRNMVKKAKGNKTSRLSMFNAIGDGPIGIPRNGISAGAKSKHKKGLEAAIQGTIDMYFLGTGKSVEEEEHRASVINEALESLLMKGSGRNKSTPKGEICGESLLSSDEEEQEENVRWNPLLPRTPPLLPRTPPPPASSQITRNGTIIAKSKKEKQLQGSELRLIPDVSKMRCLPCNPKRFQEKIEKVKEALGPTLLSHLKNLTTHRARRPYLASLFANGQGPARVHVAEALGIKLYNDEWTKVKIHARWPGPFKPVPHTQISRMRVPKDAMVALLRFIEGTTQKYAFGTKVLAICHGRETKEISNVTLRQKLDQVVATYLQSIHTGMQEQSLPENRCDKKEKGTAKSRQCLKEENHDGKCAFTSKGSICFNTAYEMASMLTGPEIKRLAGLDDVKVLKGRDNFIRARNIVDALLIGDENDNMKKRIDKQEEFFKVDYIAHLRSNSKNNDVLDDIACPDKDNHGPSCTQCADGFAIFQELRIAIEEKEANAQTNRASALELQRLDQLKCDIETCISDLQEYRGHLARHKAEEEQAMLELEQLDDDTAIVTSDYKMKILSCFFRENQKKWFGKRGTTTLGFMIVTNPDDPALKEKGIKDVKFVMMVTDDSCQDDWAVAASKLYIYQNHLPQRVNKAIFVADGAGCFKSKLHRAIQGFWQIWAGVTEIKYRNTPAGDGKTSLDGMFGRCSVILASAVDNGASYWNKESILAAVEESNGLSSTTFVGYSPVRENQLHVEIADSQTRFSSSILSTSLASDCSNSSNALSYAFKHTGYGSGKSIGCSMFKFFLKGTEKNIGDEIKFYNPTTGDLDEDIVREFAPSWTDLSIATNAKQAATSHIAKPGEGRNSRQVRSKNRQNRIKARSARISESVEDIRFQQKESGLFLCEETWSETGSYCTRKFLGADGLEKHARNGVHKFPSVNAKDFMACLAGNKGSMYAIGSLPNIQSQALPLPDQVFPPTEVGTPAEVAARCFGAFNRPDTTVVQQKTDAQICFLLQCFGLAHKLNPKQTVAKMRTEIDPTDSGLKFCNSKKHLQNNGSVLTEEQICSWQSQEVKKRDANKNVSGVIRMKTLQRHLGVLKSYIASNQTCYWELSRKVTGKIVDAIVCFFEIREWGGLSMAEKKVKLQELHLGKARIDAMVLDVEARIALYAISIEASKGANHNNPESQRRLEEERCLILNHESAAGLQDS